MRARIDPPAEAIVLAGAGRAILLQLAHPAVGYGVARHSDFARDPLARLHGTLMYVYAVMAGTRADRDFASAFVSRMHAPVHSEGNASTPAYDADDERLQLWVAATLYDTAIDVHDRVLGHLPPARADALYERYAALGTSLRVPQSAWPSSRAAFAAYWARAQSELHVDATIRAQADALWAAVEAPFWLRRLMPAMRFVTAGLLPEPVREGFGLRWGPGHQRAFDALWRMLAVVYPVLPARVRTWPQRYYLRRLRAYAAR